MHIFQRPNSIWQKTIDQIISEMRVQTHSDIIQLKASQPSTKALAKYDETLD